MLAFWILLPLSVFHFVLAAPVAVKETLEVRSNPVEVFKDGIAAWEKRVVSDDVRPDDAPVAAGGNEESVDAEGIEDKEKWRREAPQSLGKLGPKLHEEEFRVDKRDDAGNDHTSDDKDKWSTSDSDAHLKRADPEKDSTPPGDGGDTKYKLMWNWVGPQNLEKLGSADPGKDSIRPDGGPGASEEKGISTNYKLMWNWVGPQNLDKLGYVNNKGPEDAFRADDPAKSSLRPDVAPADAEAFKYSAQEMWGWDSPLYPERTGLGSSPGGPSVSNKNAPSGGGGGSAQELAAEQHTSPDPQPQPQPESKGAKKVDKVIMDIVHDFWRRDSGSGAGDASNTRRELHGTVDTNA